MSEWELTSWVARSGEPGPPLCAWARRGHAAVAVSTTAKPCSANIAIDLKYIPGIRSNKEKE